MKRGQAATSLLLESLGHPESAVDLTEERWDLLLVQARRADVLARMASRFEKAGLNGKVEGRVRVHLESAQVVAADNQRQLLWEVNRIRRALRETGASIILLKGAAYASAGLSPAGGRLCSDVDILMPKGSLGDAERLLRQAGWEAVKLDEYDQHYYRTWMHELPPLRHRERQTFVDIHHNLLPETSRLRLDPRPLLEAARPLEHMTSVKVLAPADMVLHTAVHLFHDGDLEGGLRDLLDLDDLIRAFSRAPDFWQKLDRRADELGLTRPLFYALRYTQRFLGTPIPEEVRRARRPGALRVAFMDAVVIRSLVGQHAVSDLPSRLARWLLYLRSHWLRMPPWLLLRHLARKALQRRRP
jgi:hypothetical protein